MDEEEYRVIVVDDDISNLKVAGSILSENGIRVTALNSGSALLDIVARGNIPDLILLDVLMPGMDGFETIEKLRSSGSPASRRIPVVFLTADDNKDTEAKGFALGALDFIGKPFDPVLLVRRVQNIIANIRHIKALSKKAKTDELTGLLNKSSAEERLTHECRDKKGTLMIIDIDSFKPINDIYGHEAGDMILAAFSGILRQNVRSEDIIGRIGGDEFIVFMKNSEVPEAAVKIVRRLNDQLIAEAKKILGDDMKIPLGVSGGAVISEFGCDYREMFAKADRTLLTVKQNGKHDCSVYREENSVMADGSRDEDLKKLCIALDERSAGHRALCPGPEAFGVIYRYLMRHIQRYTGTVQKVLMTVMPRQELPSPPDIPVLMERICSAASRQLRNSDVIYRCSPNQLFLLLPMVSDNDLPGVMSRIIMSWEKEPGSESVSLSYVSERAGSSSGEYPAVNGLDWRYALLNLPTGRLLEDAVENMYHSMPARLERLERFYADILCGGPTDSYRTEVHAMKGASAMIGLMPLSGLAKLLEGYARNGDTNGIRTLHGLFVKEWEKAREDIGSAFGYEENNNAAKDGKNVLPALLGVLKGSLEQMDMEAVDRTLTKIRSYSFDAETAGKIERLARASMELDNSAYEIIKELTV